jgi:hypothetical protein
MHPSTVSMQIRRTCDQASGNLHIENGWKDVSQTARAFVSNNIWRAPIAACALGGLMVVLFNVLSCLVLVRCVRCGRQGRSLAPAWQLHIALSAASSGVQCSFSVALQNGQMCKRSGVVRQQNALACWSTERYLPAAGSQAVNGAHRPRLWLRLW